MVLIKYSNLTTTAMKQFLTAIALALLLPLTGLSAAEPSFRALVLTERGGQHEGFTAAALEWLDGFSQENNFTYEEINSPRDIDSAFLARFKVFIQLDYPPYNWPDKAKAAFEQAIFDGTIGWVGFHHATLLGDFDGFPMWQWFSEFMGGRRFKNYIAETASGKIEVEQPRHPVMKGVSRSFTLPREEWYTFNRSPRPGVKVLAHVDEASYSPASDVRMGDHPAVWTNEKVKARNVYFIMGHHAELLRSKDFTTMFGNAILWASGPGNWFPRFRMLIHVNDGVEPAHREFAADAVRFFRDMTIGDGFVVDTTNNADDLNDEKLRTYHVVVSVNDNPGHTEAQRAAFRRYMENGGAWMGFHAAAYNDASTGWPWFTDFLGGGVFHRNNWPPLPAKLTIDDPAHPVTKGMPPSFISPENEWYQWRPSPRERKNIRVLVSLSPENYPIGFKDTVEDGDFPVVWTNTDYNMVYLNMGHGRRIFTDATQNYLVYNALRWLMRDRFAK